MPLNNLGYFLRTDGSRGSFAALLQAIAKARITGVEPVEIMASDFTAPIGARPKLKLRISNVLNQPIQGRLAVKVEGLVIQPEEQTISLDGQESREVFVTSERRRGRSGEQLQAARDL